MPCHEPEMTKRDDRAFVTGELINLFHKRLGMPCSVPGWITKRNYIYPMGAHLDEAAAILCAFCRTMGEDYIYGDARDRDLRHLADWWEEHQKSEGHEV